MAEQGDIEHTLVMSDTSGTETGSKSGSQRSDIVIEGSHKTIETVDLNADSSLEFRRTLEKSGKRYQIRKMIAEGGFGRIFLAKDLVLMHCTGENATEYLRSRLSCEVATLPVGRSVTL